MYRRFYGLRESPFSVNPDPRYLFMTTQTQEALAGLTYGIQNRKGFVLLTGEVGTGKTTLLNRLLDWLRGQQVATAYIFNSRLEVNHLFDFIISSGKLFFNLLLRFYSRHRFSQYALGIDHAHPKVSGIGTCGESN